MTIDVVNRLPKQVAYKAIGEGLMANLDNCLALVILAFKLPEGESRLEKIDELILCFTLITTSYRILRNKKMISEGQYGEFLKKKARVDCHIANWSKAQKTSVS